MYRPPFPAPSVLLLTLLTTIIGCGELDGTRQDEGSDSRGGAAPGGPGQTGDAAVNAGLDAAAGAVAACSEDWQCDDGLYCTGRERCRFGACEDGPAIECDDGQECTTDRCDDEQRRCVFMGIDADQDGHIDATCMGQDGLPLGDDCDDNDDQRFPGNIEICDAQGHDEDCIPTTLAGLDGDADEDGFTSDACCFKTSSGSLECGDDCDDNFFGVHAGAVEVCNGIDDNCDGLLNHPDEDNDNDGYADDRCAGTQGQDCDDRDPMTFLGAPELCDGIDNDCMVNGTRRFAGESAAELGEDADGDGHASPTAECDPTSIDGRTIFPKDDCDDRDPDVYPGAQEVCDGVDNDCDGVADNRPGSDVRGSICFPTSVSVGDSHSCAVFDDGRAACWGSNGNDRLGDPRAGSSAAVMVPGLDDITAVAVGGPFTCVLRATGKVVCFGVPEILLEDNWRFIQSEPVFGEVMNLSGVSSISAGSYHACAVAAGKVWCWGESPVQEIDGKIATGYDQLASGPTSFHPVEVTDLPEDVVQVDVGTRFTCAVGVSGKLYCWGESLGWFEVFAFLPRAVTVMPGLANVTSVAVGGDHLCALLEDETVSCIGGGTHGQLGAGTTDSMVVVPIPDLTGVTAIRAGGSHSCAQLRDGRLVCWGRNNNGQLGVGDTASYPGPQQVVDLLDPGSFSCGNNHNCAIDGPTVKCWGNSGAGKLGDGRSANELSPAALSMFARPIRLIAGNTDTCFQMPDGALRCSGRGFALFNEYQAIGYPWPVHSPYPFEELGQAIGTMAIGDHHACYALQDGTVTCTGRGGGLGDSPERIMPPAIPDGVHLAAGVEHGCASTDGGQVVCWGRNERGQLGGSQTPAVAMDGVEIEQLTAGDNHTCARTLQGEVWCWGDNDRGQVGGSPIAQPIRSAQRVAGLPAAAIDIDARGNTTCAVIDNGGLVMCWGDNASGQFGTELPSYRLQPANVPGVSQALEVEVSGSHVCARLGSGQVICWGSGEGGRLGDGQMAASYVPVSVLGLFDAEDLECGGDYCCATREAGQAVCWGVGNGGVLGDGVCASHAAPAPVPVLELNRQWCCGDTPGC